MKGPKLSTISNGYQKLSEPAEVRLVTQFKHVVWAETFIGVMWKKVFLKTSQNSQANACATASFIIKWQA